MEQSNEQRLGTLPIPKLMISLAIPSVIAQIINVLYNIVDRIYIGHMADVGDIALTGVGVTFPIIMLISAFSYFVGSGGAPLASIQLGRQNKEKAEQILGNGTSLLILFSIVLTLFFFFFKTPLLYLFGASNSTIIYANDYLDIYLLGTIFVQLSLGLNLFISSQGQAKTAMLSVLIGAVTNIVLDPIFIFGLHMGVRGAAIATIISQAFSAIWVVSFLTSKRSAIRIRLRYLKPDFEIIKHIASLGISPFIMQSTESLINIVLNHSLQLYGGDIYVGSMTIIQSVMQLIVVPIQGFTQGVQPIISYNFGASQFDRVKKTFFYTVITTFLLTTLSCILTTKFPTFFARFFTDKESLIFIVGEVMPIFMSGIFMFGIQMGCQTAFMGLGQAKISLFLALLRKVILLVPLAILLPLIYGTVTSIYYAEPISDILSATIAGILFFVTRKKILSPQALERLS
ncbi:MAG TPA: MATE family efflux transporter [Candidatus Scybalomonas excrementigallinarum]|nr:MATE family efflux transporter [Candidatus Scybalomonas excrementigallinarum]